MRIIPYLKMIKMKPIKSISLVLTIVTLTALQSCEDYVSEASTTQNQSRLRIFKFGGEFGKSGGTFETEYNYFYIDGQLNNTFGQPDVPVRIAPPAEFVNNDLFFQKSKYLLTSSTVLSNDQYRSQIPEYVDLADAPPYTYGNTKLGYYFPGFYYLQPTGGIMGGNDFGRWAIMAPGQHALKINPLQRSDVREFDSNELYQIPSDDFTETTINLEANKTYTGIWAIESRSTEELPAKDEKPVRKLVLIEEPVNTVFENDASYIRFINVTEKDLTEAYSTPPPNNQFPDIGEFYLYKATTPHPVQSVDIYIRETYNEEGTNPWDEADFSPKLATQNLVPFNTENAKFTSILSLKSIATKGQDKLPRVEIFIYPAGTVPQPGVAPAVYINDLKLLLKGRKKLSATIATLVFAIEDKGEFDATHKYRGFIYNFIPANSFDEFYN